MATNKINKLDNKLKAISQDELDVRDKERFLSTEVEVLKEKCRSKEQEARDCYSREEKV